MCSALVTLGCAVDAKDIVRAGMTAHTHAMYSSSGRALTVYAVAQDERTPQQLAAARGHATAVLALIESGSLIKPWTRSKTSVRRVVGAQAPGASCVGLRRVGMLTGMGSRCAEL